MVCHQSKGNEHPKEGEKGFTLVAKIPDLCNNCHKPLNVQKELHHPVKQGHCQYCHDAHGASRRNLVVSGNPDLCYVCHSKLEKQMNTSKNIHSVVIKSVSCSNCHNPHQSNEKKLLLQNEKDMCFKCHNKTIVAKQRVIGNIKSELTKNQYIHGEITKNGCSGCHDPHASSYSDLLKAGYNSFSNYIDPNAKDDIGLCLRCHDPELVRSQKTSSSTGFRNKEENLHFVHVNKEKGRNCINCHGIHSAPNPSLLVNSVKFGQWEMPMVYTKNSNGGSCITSCHVQKSYTR